MLLSRLLPGVQQCVEPTALVERRQIVAATDVPAVDEDLRHRGASAGAADRLLTLGRAVRGIDLAERGTLAGEQADGS
jgi:hypothetical protein